MGCGDNMYDKKDTFKAVLTNSDDNRFGGTINEAVFNLGFSNKKNNYEYIELYVDNFCIDTDDLGNQFYCVRADFYQPNSINSLTNGSNDIIATVVQPNLATSRTVDLALTYQNPTAPIQIGSIPNKVSVRITNIENNNTIDLYTNNNFYILNLRFIAYYN